MHGYMYRLNQLLCLLLAGVVKQNDMRRAPPFGVTTSRDMREYSYLPVVSYRKVPRLKPTPEDRYYTKYNDHAKKGFKYWHDDKKPMQGQCLIPNCSIDL